MNQKSLKTRILLLTMSTLLCLIMLVGVQLKQRVDRLKSADSVSKSLHFYVVTSDFIQELQKERGKSSLFINGKVDESELKIQLELANKKRELVLPTAVEVGDSTVGFIQDIVRSHEEIRRAVISKNIKALESTVQFSNLIAKLIDKQAEVAQKHPFDGLEGLLTSQTIFETSKEYMGILRATMNGVLGNDVPLTREQEAKIFFLKAAVSINLHSKGVVFGDETKNEVEKIFKSDEWRFVESALETVRNKASEGKYGVEAAEFAKKITICIDEVFKVLNAQTKLTETTIEDVKKYEVKQFWLYIGIITIILIVSLAFAWVLTSRLNRDFEKIVQELDAGIEVILNSSKEIASSSSILSSSSTEQAASLEETVSSIEEVSSMVTINSTHASESAKLSGVSQKQAQSGEEMMTNLVQVMNEISEASKKIQDITSVIDDIAFQTNLLALNAAVEAARAGEQGKGFAVVADAVRSLAQRSAEAAKDISAMISGSVGKIQSGVNVVQQNSGLLHEIVDSISKVSSINSDIASSSQDQSVGLQQINQAMNQLDQATQGNASAAERLAQTSSSMENQVETFQNVIVTLRKIVNGESKAS